MSTEKNLDKDGKDKKIKDELSVKKSNSKAPAGGKAFGKGTLTQNTDGTWKAAVTGINGDPRKNVTALLPAGITYFGGGRIPNPSEATLYLPDSVNVDARYIFPWTNNDPDPMRLGGGIVTGEIIEGAQRMDPKPKDPIQAPFLTSDWVNGTPNRVQAYIPSELGVVFYPNDDAFALILVAVENGVTTNGVIAVAKKEGTALDLPPA